MQLLSLNFLLYTISGIWRPIEWSSIGSTLLYSAYTVLIIYLMTFLITTQLLDIILIVDNVEDFTANSLLFISVISAFSKMFTPLIRRGRIIDLIETLQRPPCRVCDQEEVEIQAKFDRSIRSRSLYYLFLATSSATGALAGAMLAILKGQLPLRVWVPYDYSTSLLFWLTSVQLLLSVSFGTIINISTETLVYGLCLQTCAQLEILTHRLQRVALSSPGARESDTSPKRASRLSEHVCHHLCIIRYAEQVNEIYSQVFFTQFFASILVLCSSVYYLSSHLTLEDIATMGTYTFCMFVQIFVYCWAGNEVILKSTNLSDAIYEMEWILMTISERKDLLMIMKRCTKPIRFSSSFLVMLSLRSYGKLLKASYSAFNVLQHLSGIWRPVEWSSSCAKMLYNAFTVYTIVSLYFLMLTQFMDILLIVDNVDDFTNNSLIFVSIITVCCKSTIIVLRRNAIIDLVEMLLRDPYKPRNEDELAIQATFDKFIRSCSIMYLLLTITSVTTGSLRSLSNIIEGRLPYRVWLPYDWNKSPMFLITSIYQLITIFLAGLINVGTETVVFGFILQTCAQLDILKSRLNKSVIKRIAGYQKNRPRSGTSGKQATISELILYHLSIYTYANEVNCVFNQILFVQFFGSILVLCTSVYYVSLHIGETEAAGILAYTVAMFVQIFVYCWSGNEVILKVQWLASLADAVYHVEWSSLSIRERKDLLIIMMRSAVPIKFTSSFLITMSLESYNNILKTSYSAFNVLQS
ncbi:PREDICTED: odorant receptor Or1-like [Dinoponera quadriceps]|uniref:Odorant receptor Or1-like n=1 Tax=Dinoponera quadriceps TaxID=609295 RepID=A0A6P3Y6X4_DINQU|nr:PREDICTED: odorant receptor Or1-like [Dinoponera quadriceps]